MGPRGVLQQVFIAGRAPQRASGRAQTPSPVLNYLAGCTNAVATQCAHVSSRVARVLHEIEWFRTYNTRPAGRWSTPLLQPTAPLVGF